MHGISSTTLTSFLIALICLGGSHQRPNGPVRCTGLRCKPEPQKNTEVDRKIESESMKNGKPSAMFTELIFPALTTDEFGLGKGKSEKSSTKGEAEKATSNKAVKTVPENSNLKSENNQQRLLSHHGGKNENKQEDGELTPRILGPKISGIKPIYIVGAPDADCPEEHKIGHGDLCRIIE